MNTLKPNKLVLHIFCYINS